MIDPKHLPDDPDAWVKPDISQPRSITEFINDVWVSRKSPVYSLRPLEVAILQSKTCKGWLWRAVISLFRHKKLPVMTALPADLAGAPFLLFAFDPMSRAESEASMRRYVAITEKFHPVLAASMPPPPEPGQPHSYHDAMTCSVPIRVVSRKKKPRKKPAKNRPKPAKRR